MRGADTFIGGAQGAEAVGCKEGEVGEVGAKPPPPKLGALPSTKRLFGRGGVC